MKPTRSSASFRSLLTEPNFARLWYGQIISSLGDRFYQFALLNVILGIKNGMEIGKDTARVTFCAMLPGLLFAPFYGWMVDHFSRRWIMVWSDLIRVALTMSLLYFWFEIHSLGAVFGVIFLMGAFNGLFIPARQAALPQIVTPSKLVSANALISLVGVIANLVGALFATLFTSIFGARSSFFLNAFGFIVSAFCIYRITVPLSPATHEALVKADKAGFWRTSIEGWNVLREQPELMSIAFVRAIFALVSSLVLVTILQQVVVTVDLNTVRLLAGSLAHFLGHFAPKPPVFEIRTLAFGLLFACIGLGVGLGVYICGRANRFSRSKALPFAALGLLGVALVAFAQMHEYVPALFAALFLGLLTSLTLIPIEARLQNDVDDARRGRLFALCNLGSTSAFLIGLAVNVDGRILARLGPATLIATVGAATMVVAMLLALANGAKLKAFWPARQLPEPTPPE